MPVPVLPDVLGVMCQALLGQSAVTALVGTRITDRIPDSPIWPLIVVSVVSEQEKEWHTGSARVQCDVWGRGPTSVDKLEVRAIFAALVSVSRDLRGAWSSGRISNSAITNGVMLPDPNTGRQRIAVDFHIESHAT